MPTNNPNSASTATEATSKNDDKNNLLALKDQYNEQKELYSDCKEHGAVPPELKESFCEIGEQYCQALIIDGKEDQAFAIMKEANNLGSLELCGMTIEELFQITKKTALSKASKLSDSKPTQTAATPANATATATTTATTQVVPDTKQPNTKQIGPDAKAKSTADISKLQKDYEEAESLVTGMKSLGNDVVLAEMLLAQTQFQAAGLAYSEALKNIGEHALAETVLDKTAPCLPKSEFDVSKPTPAVLSASSSAAFLGNEAREADKGETPPVMIHGKKPAMTRTLNFSAAPQVGPSTFSPSGIASVQRAAQIATASPQAAESMWNINWAHHELNKAIQLNYQHKFAEAQTILQNLFNKVKHGFKSSKLKTLLLVEIAFHNIKHNFEKIPAKVSIAILNSCKIKNPAYTSEADKLIAIIKPKDPEANKPLKLQRTDGSPLNRDTDQKTKGTALNETAEAEIVAALETGNILMVQLCLTNLVLLGKIADAQKYSQQLITSTNFNYKSALIKADMYFNYALALVELAGNNPAPETAREFLKTAEQLNSKLKDVIACLKRKHAAQFGLMSDMKAMGAAISAELATPTASATAASAVSSDAKADLSKLKERYKDAKEVFDAIDEPEYRRQFLAAAKAYATALGSGDQYEIVIAEIKQYKTNSSNVASDSPLHSPVLRPTPVVIENYVETHAAGNVAPESSPTTPRP